MIPFSRARSPILNVDGLGRVREERLCRPRYSGEGVVYSIGGGRALWHV